MITYFAGAFFAHALGDFWLQKDGLVKQRNSQHLDRRLFALIQHIIIHGLALFGVTAIVHFLTRWFLPKLPSISLVRLLLPFGLLLASHFILDFVKCQLLYVSKNNKTKRRFHLFYLDQLLHISAIILITWIFTHQTFYPLNQLDVISKCLLASTMVIYTLSGAAIFIRLFIGSFSISESPLLDTKKTPSIKQGAERGGYYIGLLERLFIVIALLYGQTSMIGFILTGKSIARFKKLDDPKFAEYFLIGTLMSFIAGILGGCFIKALQIF